MSKRKSSMDIDDVMNDINKWLEDSDDETEDDLNEANGDENENEEILPSGQNASEDELILIVMILVLLKIDLSTENSSHVNA